MKKNLIALTLFAVVSMAQAEVSISSVSLQELTQKSKSGEVVKAWVKTQKVVPGTIVRYVNTLENSGETVAKGLSVKNPIPENMEYVDGSASCEGTCTLTFSVDDGKSFKKPSELYVGEDEQRHLAMASEYTNIQWMIAELSAHSKSFVDYKAKLK